MSEARHREDGPLRRKERTLTVFYGESGAIKALNWEKGAGIFIVALLPEEASLWHRGLWTGSGLAEFNLPGYRLA